MKLMTNFARKRIAMIDISDEKQRLDLYYKIRGAAITVQRNLGSHLIEKFYEKALIFELKSMGLSVGSQVPIPTFYKNEPLDLELVADLVVENEIIIELKATPRIEKSHERQLLTYMKLMRRHYGLLINFGVTFMSRDGMKAYILSDFDDIVNSNINFEDSLD